MKGVSDIDLVPRTGTQKAASDGCSTDGERADVRDGKRASDGTLTSSSHPGLGFDRTHDTQDDLNNCVGSRLGVRFTPAETERGSWQSVPGSVKGSCQPNLTSTEQLTGSHQPPSSATSRSVGGHGRLNRQACDSGDEAVESKTKKHKPKPLALELPARQTYGSPCLTQRQANFTSFIPLHDACGSIAIQDAAGCLSDLFSTIVML